jgi:uracil-DNA glycosylase
VLIQDCIGCENFPCLDIDKSKYSVPTVDVDPGQIKIVMISESAPADPADYYYQPDNPLFEQTTVQAFRDAGVSASSLVELLEMGIYLTSAVKCGKTDYGIKAGTIKECSEILEKEIDLFPNVAAYLLMGDVAIKSINYIAKRLGEPRVIPAGSTYKIRGKEYFFRGARAFPSYLQAGPSFFIEKSKRRMIKEDISNALTLLET